MDQIESLFTQKIPLGSWVKVFVDYLTDNFSTQFRAFSDSLGEFQTSEGSVVGTVLGGALLGVVPSAVLLPLLVALLVASAVKVWRHR